MRTRRTRKPPYGVPIDRSHPLAQGLLGFWPFAAGGGPIVHDCAGTNHLRWAGQGSLWAREDSGPVARLSGNFTDLLQTDRPVIAATGPYTVAIRFRPTDYIVQGGLFALGSTAVETATLHRFQLNGDAYRNAFLNGLWSSFFANFPLDAHHTMVLGWDGARGWMMRNGAILVNNATIADSGAVPPYRLFVGMTSGAQQSAISSVDYIAVWGRFLPWPQMRTLSADDRLIWSLFRPRPERPFSQLWEFRRGRRTLYPRVGSRGIRV